MKRFREDFVPFEDKNLAYNFAMSLDFTLCELHPKKVNIDKEEIVRNIVDNAVKLSDRHSRMLSCSLKYALDENDFDLAYEICCDFVWLMMDADIYKILDPYKTPAKLLLPEVKLEKSVHTLKLPKKVVLSEYVKDLIDKV